MANKDTKTASGAKEPTNQQQYFYPEHGITIEAETKEDADKQLAERLESLKEIKAASDGAEDTE